MTINLQGIGQCEAVKAADLKPGMTITYNYGVTGQILSVEHVKKSVRLVTLEAGREYRSIRRMDSWVVAQ
jgi:hypothetical protein